MSPVDRAEFSWAVFFLGGCILIASNHSGWGGGCWGMAAYHAHNAYQLWKRGSK